ncbi:PASTA domain-containing protein [Nocardia cyriacigeorgica]|uniref:PASTA domain-containing protein n=1 Tax=Nocardia cyriacigeorgica TaxID=135487 RepID=UPI002454EA89|nr:PASTA domain-containing protein [Nocardia cyriacigeorgica]
MVNQLIPELALHRVDAGEAPSSAPEGTLAKVDPAPGTVLPMGAHVKVYTSKGSQPVTLPDLRGKTTEEAQQMLTDLGITVSGNRPQFDRSVAAGDVVGTDPAAGTTVESGSSVVLLVSDAVKMPEVLGKSVAEARDVLEGLGLTVQVRQLAPLDSSVVVSQTPAMNANVQAGATVTIVALP